MTEFVKRHRWGAGRTRGGRMRNRCTNRAEKARIWNFLFSVAAFRPKSDRVRFLSPFCPTLRPHPPGRISLRSSPPEWFPGVVRFCFSAYRFAAWFCCAGVFGYLVFRLEIGSFGMSKTHERPNDERMDGRCSKCRKLLYE